MRVGVSADRNVISRRLTKSKISQLAIKTLLGRNLSAVAVHDNKKRNESESKEIGR